MSRNGYMDSLSPRVNRRVLLAFRHHFICSGQVSAADGLWSLRSLAEAPKAIRSKVRFSP